MRIVITLDPLGRQRSALRLQSSATPGRGVGRERHLDKGLDAAPLKSWTVASMKDDWNHIFPTEK